LNLKHRLRLGAYLLYKPRAINEHHRKTIATTLETRRIIENGACAANSATGLSCTICAKCDVSHCWVRFRSSARFGPDTALSVAILRCWSGTCSHASARAHGWSFTTYLLCRASDISELLQQDVLPGGFDLEVRLCAVALLYWNCSHQPCESIANNRFTKCVRPTGDLGRNFDHDKRSPKRTSPQARRANSEYASVLYTLYPSDIVRRRICHSPLGPHRD
jgi:hypothetical protein